MDIIPNTNAIPVSVSQTAKVGNNTKVGGSTSKDSKGSSFSEALGSAVRSNPDPKEHSNKDDQQGALEKPIGTPGESIPLLNVVPVLPTSSPLPLAARGEQFSTDATPDSTTLTNLDSVNKVSDQSLSMVPKPMTVIEALAEQKEKQLPDKPGSSQLVNADEIQSQTGANQTINTVPSSAPPINTGKTKQSIVQSNLMPATDDSNAVVNGKKIELSNTQGASKENNQTLTVTLTKSAPSSFLKPLESVATYQQAALSLNSKFNENKPSNLSVETIAAIKANNQSAHMPVTSAALASDVQQELKNSLTASNLDFGKQNDLDNAVDKPIVAFQHVLNQVSKNDPPIAAQVVSQPSSPSVQDPNNVINQIVEHARLIKSPEASEMVIKLKPEHLGELTLKVAVDQGVVSATFHTNNNEVRGIIESSVQQLRQDMSQQGLKVEYVGVYAGLGQPFSNGQGEANKQQTWKAQSAKKITDDENIEALAAVEKVSTIGLDSGVDYRV